MDLDHIERSLDLLRNLLGPLIHGEMETPEQFMELRDNTVADAGALAEMLAMLMIAIAQDYNMESDCEYFHSVVKNYERKRSEPLN